MASSSSITQVPGAHSRHDCVDHPLAMAPGSQAGRHGDRLVPPRDIAKTASATPLTRPAPASPTAGKPSALATPLALAPPDADPAILWTPRSRDFLDSFLPHFADFTAGESLAPLSAHPAAAQCLKTYLGAAVDALRTEWAAPLLFVPPTDAIAVYLLSRIRAWIAAFRSCQMAAAILAGCEARVQTMHEDRRLQSKIEVARGTSLFPNDEIFVRLNSRLTGDDRTGSCVPWLTPDDARWLLGRSDWSPCASQILGDKAGLKISMPSYLEGMLGQAKYCVTAFGSDAETFNGTTTAHGAFREGQAEGYGVLTWAGGKTYRGTFVGGRCHGWGMLVDGSTTYEGEFKDGSLTG